MTIYIACIKAGQNEPVCAYSWRNKYEFFLYCNELLMMRDTKVNASMTVGKLCDAIQDIGFGGIGSRTYFRMDRRSALKILD